MPGEPTAGARKIAWARDHMPVLEGIRARWASERPLEGRTVSIVLHLEAKTAALVEAIARAGATPHVAAGNPLTTDDDVAASLASAGIAVHARRGESVAEYRAGLSEVLHADPEILIDDGADLVVLAHTERPDRGRILGSTEETTTGVTRLKALERAGRLRFPAIDVNDAAMKHLFDNRFGTGQSVVDGLLSATNLLIAGRVAVVAGFGWVGRGVADRLRGLGAEVVVTEVDPVKAIEARLSGFEVRPMLDAARSADLIVTATGTVGVVRAEHLKVLKDGCVMANAGHFDIEISRPDLEGLSIAHSTARPGVERYDFPDGRKAYLLTEGRLVNLAAGQGHPVEIMDLSFSLQARAVEHLAVHGRDLPIRVHPVPPAIDEEVARAALGAFGVALDEPTDAQRKYADRWEGGTW